MNIRFRIFVCLLLLLLFDTPALPHIYQSNDQGNGLIEIAGPTIGLEFHKSRPVPSRISFFEPVANSMDIHHDGWSRDSSMVFRMQIGIDGEKYSVEDIPFTYEWTPYSVNFEGSVSGLPMTITYRFTKTQNLAEMVLAIDPDGREIKEIIPQLLIATVLRTCHTYDWRHPDVQSSPINGQAVSLNYPYIDTDSASVVFWSDTKDTQWSFLSDGPLEPGRNSIWLEGKFPKELQKGEKLTWKWRFTSAGKKQIQGVQDSIGVNVSNEIESFENSLLDYGLNHSFELEDSSLIETAVWSRVMLEALKHPLDGQYVPMPCPAQYNFYFTHDALVTDLSAVLFDLDRVKNDLDYIRSKATTDSIIPHAYYWKDGDYRTEYCGPENWNHYWFIQVLSAYLKHGGSKEYVAEFVPLMDKSIRMILSNEGPDGLIHGKGPDWWDAGNVPGGRSYHTSLAIRTLREYLYIRLRLNPEEELPEVLILAGNRLAVNLEELLWDEDSEFLLNLIGEKKDQHYYCGSLVAGWFQHLDNEKRQRLIATAESELLDSHMGLRVAMPPDFHLLKDAYRFNGMEMGEPYMYFNGSVWPNSNAWYINALIYNGKIDKALNALKKYMTLEGIKNSPNGQPSFYEFRYTNPNSEDYGKIYKPNFLWAGGWYLYGLYGLCGVRENAENISLDTNIPWDSDFSYGITFGGEDILVEVAGEGNTASNITWDGQPSGSLVLYGDPKAIHITRGAPESPYLEGINAIVKNVKITEDGLTLDYLGIPGDNLVVTVVSPFQIRIAKNGSEEMTVESEIPVSKQGYRSVLTGKSFGTMRINIIFEEGE